MSQESKFFHTKVGASINKAAADQVAGVIDGLREQVYSSIKEIANKMDRDYEHLETQIKLTRKELFQAYERSKDIEAKLATTNDRLSQAQLVAIIVFVSSLVAVIFWR